VREPVPATGGRGARGVLCCPAPARGRQRVHPRAERRQDRGEDRQRHEARDQRGQHATDPHAVQEPQREDEQRRHRRGDRQRAEEHGSAGGGERALQRGPRPVAERELFAEARQDEQAVVDRQAEAHARHEVEREDRQAGHTLVDAAHEQEGREDREPAHQRRQQRRDEAAEDPQREQEEDREGQHLRLGEVLADAVADLVLQHLGAADERPARRVGTDGRGDFALVDTAERSGEDRGAPVAGEERGVARARKARGALDAAPAAQLLLVAPQLAARAGVAPRVAAERDERDQAEVGIVAAERALELAIGLVALRSAVLEVAVVGAELARDRDPERAGEHEEGGGDQQHALGAVVKQAGEAGHRVRSPSWVWAWGWGSGTRRRTQSSRAASSSRSIAAAMLSSMPLATKARTSSSLAGVASRSISSKIAR
jgi:hypothetical protein